MLIGPSGGSSEDEAIERGGMQEAVEDSEGFFLQLFRVKAQHLSQRLKVQVPQWGDAGRQGWQGGGSQEVEIMKGPLNALQDVPRNASKKVVSEAIVCTEKASSDRPIIPAGVRQSARTVTFQRKVRERGDKDAPRVSPT